ncbi:hypothetical protein WJX72_006888 [[Myrmecia] bisecta]|uniref:Uncharacterized protein n=1 Tax=[Myrmecia] bisecta TaxID=41462 RepID=A0AAW1QAX2_9CHLO
MSYEQVIQQVKLEDLQDHEVHQALEQAISDFLGPAAKRLTIDGQVAEDLLNRHLLGPPKVAAALIRHAVVQNRRATAMAWTLAFNDAQMESNFRSSLMYTRWAPTRWL